MGLELIPSFVLACQVMGCELPAERTVEEYLTQSWEPNVLRTVERHLCVRHFEEMRQAFAQDGIRPAFQAKEVE